MIKRMDVVRLRVLVHDMECMGCGSFTGKNDIHLHHVNMDRTDDRLRNLSLLCRMCHSAAHRNIDGGWRRSLTPIPSIANGGKNRLKLTWEERFNDRFKDLGGADGFRKLYLDDSISMAEIGIKFGVVRERVRQYAFRLDLPPRGVGFMDNNKRTHYGFPYKHKHISDYLQSNNITPRDFAAKCGLSYANLNQLLNMVRPVSVSRGIEIVSASDGALTMEQLLNPFQQDKPTPEAAP